MELTVHDMVSIVTHELNDAGVEVDSSTVDRVLRSYLSAKQSAMLAGNAIVETGIGTVRPSWRKVSGAFNPKVPFTAKLVTDIDGGLKSEIINKLSYDQHFRTIMGAQEL